MRTAALASLRPPAEVLLRLVNDPEIEHRHLNAQGSLSYLAGTQIFPEQPEQEQEFQRVLLGRAKLEVRIFVY